MPAAEHVIVRTSTPAETTLRTMGRTARDASSTWTLREWAGRLAARARPRDYVGQLAALYHGILDRWRYVQEPEEWIHGSARSLLGTVLGLHYNTRPGTNVERVRVDRVPTREKGFGDCDDVATLTAAGVAALGMQPYFRVVRGPSGAHVSVLARTPRGEVVSLDPVGHPDHPFGWALPSEHVEIWTLDGQNIQASAFGAADPQMRAGPGLTLSLHVPISSLFQGVDTMANYSTALGMLDRPDSTTPTHTAIVPIGELPPNVIALPARHARIFKRGLAVDMSPGVDEQGRSYLYDAPRDAWIDTRLLRRSRQFGGYGATFAQRVRRRWRKRWAGVRRIAKRIFQPIRNLAAKIMESPAGQRIASAALAVVGVPPRLTRAVLEAGADILRKGGLPALVRTLRRDPQAAARMVAAAARKGLREAASFAGVDMPGDCPMRVIQGGRAYYGGPVAMLSGVPGFDELGAVEVRPTPQKGAWYRIQKGDVLLTVASRAYGTKRGTPENYAAAKWINNAKANAPYFEPKNTDNLFPKGKISFSPKWSCDADKAIEGEAGSCYAVIWIPMVAGDEPPEQLPPPPTVEPEPEPLPPPPTTIPPAQPLPPPAPLPPPIAPAPPPEPAPAPTLPPAPPVETCGPGTVWDPYENRCVPFTPAPKAPTYPTAPVPVPTEPPIMPPTPEPTCPPDQVYDRGFCVPFTPAPKAPTDVTRCPEGMVFNLRRGACVPRELPPMPPEEPAPLPPSIEPIPTGPAPFPPSPPTGEKPWPLLLLLALGI